MLARRAADGDQQAFATIYERYHQQLYRYCRSIVRDPEDARDALQNTMVNALRAMGRRQPGSLKAWLYRIAHNESITFLRRRRSHEDIDEVADRGALAVAADSESAERLRELMADLSELPVRQRGALVMRELSGLEYAEIGDAFGVSTAAAKQTVYEARTALHDQALGRDMDCRGVRQTLSAGDKRMLRGRKIGAHLRDCRDCRDFRAALDERPRSLAALAPALPTAAAAALLDAALGLVASPSSAGPLAGLGAGGGGAAGGGASAGGSAAAMGTASSSGSGLMAGAGQALIGSTVVKSAAAATAAIAVGAGSYAVAEQDILSPDSDRPPPRPAAEPARSAAGRGAVAGRSSSGERARRTARTRAERLAGRRRAAAGSGGGGPAPSDGGRRAAPTSRDATPGGGPASEIKSRTPATPERPSAPRIPSAPAAPKRPELPSTPKLPGTPQPPAAPSLPAAPGTPSTPSVPSVPTVPRELPVVPTIQAPAPPSVPSP